MAESHGTISVRMPDGSTKSVLRGTAAGEILQDWRPREAHSFVAAVLDGEAIDLSRTVEQSSSLAPLTTADRLGREILQHSAAHVLAKAVTEVEPSARPILGPPTDEGFYYDFDVRPLTPADLEKVEASIRQTVKSSEPFTRLEVSRPEALKTFQDNPHKAEYIAEVPEGKSVTLYRTGDWVDLCRGPHVPDAGWLKGLHILGFSAITTDAKHGGGSYQRVRGIAFPTREELNEYLKRRHEAEARDHRVLGAKLELFSFSDDVPGFPFWLPNGMLIIRELERFVVEHLKEAGYGEIRTPLLFSESVYKTSGHWDHFRENMFLLEVDGRPYGLKPMNCPGSMILFGSRARSYRELPLRWAEFAPLHRLEPSGTLHGITRVRELVQDDAHIFVTEEQVEPEIRTLLRWIEQAFATFHLEWSVDLSTRPAGFMGAPEDWDRAEASLERILQDSKVPHRVAPGEGGFYAPKIDIQVKDSLGRPWQTGTIQLDYQMPKRFKLEYQGADGRLHTPIVIHRTILGTWERFLGVFLEHTNGRLPPWMAPVQVRVLPVTERHQSAADSLLTELRASSLRAELAGPDETLGKRVRAAEIERVPYVAVLGDQEVSASTVAVRLRGEKAQRTMSRPEFIGHVAQRVRSRAFDP